MGLKVVKGCGCTDGHPDGESDPRTHIQLHHELYVDINTEQRQPGKQGDLKKTEMWGKKSSLKHTFNQRLSRSC